MKTNMPGWMRHNPNTDDFVFEADVNKLFALCNPFYYGDPWEIGPFSVSDVRQYMTEDNTHSRPYYNYGHGRVDHLKRIAWLTMNGWDDPILVDVGSQPGYNPSWIIDDGNHRFVASIVLGKQSILASGSGDLEILESLRYIG